MVSAAWRSSDLGSIRDFVLILRRASVCSLPNEKARRLLFTLGVLNHRCIVLENGALITALSVNLDLYRR